MATATQTAPDNYEAKILQAAQAAESAVAVFSPAAAQAVQAGVAVEPMVSGLVKMFISIFKHHATK